MKQASNITLNSAAITLMLWFAGLSTAMAQPEAAKKQDAPLPPIPAGKVFKIGVVYFGPDPGNDICLEGVKAGLKDLGFIEGKNLEFRLSHAGGEISSIPALLQNYDQSDVDLIMPMSTPCITAAAGMVKKKPVVLTYCYDPIAAGAGKSYTDHLPHMTGIGSFPPIEDTVDFIVKIAPKAKVVGTVYNSSEANSRRAVEVARKRFSAAGIKLEEVTITNTSEVFQGAQAVVARGIDVYWSPGDNTVLQSFEGIVKVTSDAKLPLVINDPEFVEKGALAAIGVGFFNSGVATARPIARVLLGESPKNIPIENVAFKQIVLNYAVAAKLGIKFPDSVIEEAKKSASPRKTGAKKESEGVF